MIKYTIALNDAPLLAYHAGSITPRVDCEQLSSGRLGEPSASVGEWVQTARERQRARFEGMDVVCLSPCA